MMSMEHNSMHRMLPSNEDTRRLLYLSNLHRPTMSGVREDPQPPLPPPPQQQQRRTHPDLSGNPSHHHHHHQPQTSVKRLTYQQHPVPSNNSVSRRNARERKRVRLVNLGFSTLRERVPSGTKNKKLSKVETLRAAIEYIRQLQGMLGMPDDALERMINENFLPDDCSSSEEAVMMSGSGGGPSGGSGDLSPASSHPSECSLLPYENQHTQEDQLMDIGLWF